MRQLIQRAKQRLLQAEDTICLERVKAYTAIYRDMADAPIPIKRAHAFRHHLMTMSLDIDSNPIFAGNMSHHLKAWSLHPEYSFDIPAQALVELPHLKGMLDGEAVPSDYHEFWGPIAKGGTGSIGHLTIDQETVLRKGLSSVMEEIRQSPPTKPAENQYREAMLISLQAVIDWAERYHQAVLQRIQQTSEAELKICYSRIARALEQVPAKPARNLFEALQALVLVHYAIHLEGHNLSVSPGRLDQVLLPYYEDNEEAEDLFCAFLLKIAANAIWGSFSKTQAITLGGSDRFGNDQSNSLTLLWLLACDRMRLPDPHIFVRWHRALAPAVKELCFDMLSRGVSMPLLVGDEITRQGLINAGITPEDAANYVIVGCNELGIPGKMLYHSVNFVPLEQLLTILQTPAKRANIEDLDTLFHALELETEQALRNGIRWHESVLREEAEVTPTPFTSALMEGCIEKGCDLLLGMNYPQRVLSQQGITNLINAIAAIDQVVLQNRFTTLEKLAEALQADFVGHETLHRHLRNAPKWGNDAPALQAVAKRWMAMRDRILRRLEYEFHTPRHLNCHVTRSLNYVFGSRMGASPDGRPAGEPLSDSIGAVTGTQQEGPTALLNTICGLQPAQYWDGGYNLNLTLQMQPSRELLKHLIEPFFAAEGQELQINALDEATLLDAQQHPDHYPDLLVRVAGFSARFIDLSAEQQAEIIKRAQTTN